jgi:hypothetical protein
METEPADIQKTLRVAADVAEVLRRQGRETVVIGAMALAVHGYARDTVDFDLAVAAPPEDLDRAAEVLRALGYVVVVRKPDPGDPLGGVVDVRSPGADLVQIVNFENPPAGGFPRLVADSVAEATELLPPAQLRVVDPYHLIAFKLYAGGAKSRLDILELLERNPDLDRERLRRLCVTYRLGKELDRVLELEREED